MFYFVQISLVLYLLIFVLQSIIKQLVNILLFDHFTKVINVNSESWVTKVPNDEWIRGFQNKFSERTVTDTEDCMDIINDEESASPLDKLKKIFDSIMIDNAETFQIAVRAIFMILYYKYMFSYGRFSELFFGTLIGMAFHMYYLGKQLWLYLYNWYFNHPTTIVIENVVTEANKLTTMSLLGFSAVGTLLLWAVKITFPAWTIGSWIFDMSGIILLLTQIVGYFTVLTMIQSVVNAQKSPIILFLLSLYLMMVAFI